MSSSHGTESAATRVYTPKRRRLSSSAHAASLDFCESLPEIAASQDGSSSHIVASYAAERVQHGAHTGVSMLVVVDGESFLDALFASAVQDRGTRHHRLQVGG